MLKDIVKPGDWLVYFPTKKDWLDKIILGATFSKTNHASMIKDSETVFETDGDLFKARFTPISEAEQKHVLIIRPKELQGKTLEVYAAMKKYKGAPYGYWDIAMHGLFFWLAAPIRKKVVSALGAKHFMVCSELVARITYDVTGREELEDYEGITPADLITIAKEYPEAYEIVAAFNGTR